MLQPWKKQNWICSVEKFEVGDPVYIREPFSGKNIELEIDDISFGQKNLIQMVIELKNPQLVNSR